MEKLKEKDILESLVEEFGASFPEFKRVLIDERDICLAHSLRSAAEPASNELVPGGQSPVKVVGVVGLGHVAGIVRNWNKELDVTQILK
jgi:pheromone shutdown protein TraB